MGNHWQARSRNFAEKHNLHHSPGVYVLDLLSELGEAAKEILLATQYGERPFPHTPPVALSLELDEGRRTRDEGRKTRSVKLET